MAQEDIVCAGRGHRAAFARLFNALYQGAPLPAQGSAQACEYCEMSGLCRKDYWNDMILTTAPR